jgi:hypothetical protein
MQATPVTDAEQQCLHIYLPLFDPSIGMSNLLKDLRTLRCPERLNLVGFFSRCAHLLNTSQAMCILAKA